VVRSEQEESKTTKKTPRAQTVDLRHEQ